MSEGRATGKMCLGCAGRLSLTDLAARFPRLTCAECGWSLDEFLYDRVQNTLWTICDQALNGDPDVRAGRVSMCRVLPPEAFAYVASAIVGGVIGNRSDAVIAAICRTVWRRWVAVRGSGSPVTRSAQLRELQSLVDDDATLTRLIGKVAAQVDQARAARSLSSSLTGADYSRLHADTLGEPWPDNDESRSALYRHLEGLSIAETEAMWERIDLAG